MTIQTHSTRTTYLPLDIIAAQYNISVAYLLYMIEQLTPEIHAQLDIKTLIGKIHLGNLSQRYLLTRIDYSAASLFVDTDKPLPVVADIQELPPLKPMLEFTVRRDISNDYWLLTREDNAGTTIIGTYADQDKAEAARINQLLRTR